MARSQYYLTVAEAADRLGLSPVTLRRWVQQGDGPPHRRFGRVIRFPRDTFDAWERECAARFAAKADRGA